MPTAAQIAAVKAAIVAEFRRQTPGVYFWDRADEELLAGGLVIKSEFQDRDGEVRELALSFDMDAVATQAFIAATNS